MNTRTEQAIHRADVQIPAAGAVLPGFLAIPEGAQGIVVFAHGAGSSRLSPRNQQVAEILQEGSLATLLIDLLSEQEEQTYIVTKNLSFDIPLLARRVDGATEWLGDQEATRNLRIGYFGASTGAAATLVTASRRPDAVGAVVSRGGRVDLAGNCLARVRTPILLLVGECDTVVIDLNRQAREQLRTECELTIIPEAGHLFEEPGALEEVANHACSWFLRHLSKADASDQHIR
jgi:putative phosphoribosyl transferase